jgi:hypothetical protein
MSSDDGNQTLRVNRPGFLRIALHLPKQPRGTFPVSLSIRCYPAANAGDAQKSECLNLNLIKVVRLDEKYAVKEIKIISEPRNIKSDEKADFTLRPE